MSLQAHEATRVLFDYTAAPVWDVALLCGQSTDDVSQGRQRLVDGLSLLQLLTGGSRLLHPGEQTPC